MTESLPHHELARLHILRHVSLESVAGLLEHCTLRHLAPGETLLRAGEENRVMYLVLSGRLSVHLEPPPAEAVAELVAGQTVGELSVLDESPASAWVVATEPSRLVAVDEDTFWRLISASHDFSVNLLLLLAQRMRANNSALSENTRLRRQFEREALMDGLTGLYNRRWLDQTVPRIVRRHQVGGIPLSLLVIDVDHFKSFNDRFGHAAGDAVLRSVSETIVACLRPTDLAARFGGEELVIVLPGTPAAGARVAAERLRAAISAARMLGPDDLALPQVTVSIGLAELEDSDDAPALFARADAGVYRAKSNGRNRVEQEK